MRTERPSKQSPNLVAAALLAGALATAAPAHAFWGRFDPCTPGGTVQIAVIDSNAAHWVCIGESSRHGDVGGAVALLALTAVGGLTAACAFPDTTGSGEATLVAPISPGLGQVLGVAGTFASPDAILGHELRHLFDEDFHPAVLSGVEKGCGT
jgi:hypothetical protein